jgi:hypothetical protein
MIFLYNIIKKIAGDGISTGITGIMKTRRKIMLTA